MKKVKQSLDTRSLQLFVTVMESNSLTEAAEKLEIKQSTVSHALRKLRTIFNDPLLVRSGRSVTATSRALELLPKAKQLLAAFESIAEESIFEPSQSEFVYTIAANDFQCEVLLPALVRHLEPLVKSLQITIVPSWLPDSGMLRNEQLDMVISPVVPDGSDVMQRKLYDFKEVCFYDAKQRAAPITDSDFIEANYICPSFLLNCKPVNLSITSQHPVWLHDKTNVITNSFSGGAVFLKDSKLLAIGPEYLRNTAFRDYQYVVFPYGKKSPMYLIWNKKYQKDLKHAWFRQQLSNVAEKYNLI